MTPKTPTLLLTSTLVAACTGTIVDPEKNPGSPGNPSGPETTAQACVAAEGPAAGSTPLRRLTRLEYDNTVRDLVGDTSHPALGFVSDEAVAGFDANSVAAVSKQGTEDFLDAAAALAKTALANGLLECDAAEDTCAESFIGSFGRRAFRRPLSAEEKGDFFALYAAAKQQWGATMGIELVLRALLSSPSFLYLVEATVSGEGAVAEVDAHTLASRLSYFFWSSMPDDALFDAAATGKLATIEGIDAEARRMLADPRAKDTVESFHAQWLGIANVRDSAKDPELFPSYDAELALSMERETRRFTSHVVLEGDGLLSTLLGASFSFVDQRLASLYGAAAPSSAFAKTELNPAERAGVLTHASVMTAHSGVSETSWVHRGKLVRERFLCQPIPPPPPGVEATAAKSLKRLEDEACKGCHSLMDPIGFGFDGYSPIGSYRTVDEVGEPVITSGEVVATDDTLDVTGKFEGAVELAHRLAASEDVGRCVAVQWFRYATRRQETEADACSVAVAQTRFAESGHDVRELMIAIAKTDAFRHRAVAQ